MAIQPNLHTDDWEKIGSGLRFSSFDASGRERVDDRQAQEGRSYKLSVSEGSNDLPANISSTGIVTVGAGISTGRINVPSDADFFRMVVSAGKEYTVTMQLLDLDNSLLFVLDRAGTSIGFYDVSGDRNHQATFTAPFTGTVWVVADAFGGDTGGYQLSAFERNVINGSVRADSLVGTSGPDTLLGMAGPDLLQGNAGSDILEGGDGIDMAVYRGSLQNFGIEPVSRYELIGKTSSKGYALLDLKGDEGRDLLYGIERVRFSDAYAALDFDGHAGTTARTLGAVFGAASVNNAEYFGIGLGLLDAGMSPLALMQLALDAKLGVGARHTLIVDLLYTNVVGVRPDIPTLLYYRGLLDNGSHTPASLGLLAAETDLNAQRIDLVGIAEVGVLYIPYTP